MRGNDLIALYLIISSFKSLRIPLWIVATTAGSAVVGLVGIFIYGSYVGYGGG